VLPPPPLLLTSSVKSATSFPKSLNQVEVGSSVAGLSESDGEEAGGRKQGMNNRSR
jgi:hypothetical protein